MSEGANKSYHFNSNMRTNSGSKSTMSNNEDRYLRALEIQERKQAIIDKELEKQRIIDEAEKAVAEEKARQEAEAKAAQAEEEAANAPAKEAVIEKVPEKLPLLLLQQPSPLPLAILFQARNLEMISPLTKKPQC